MNFEAVIGLEVHAQLKTATKLFCRCANAFGNEANTLTCPVCLGLPGALPVLNQKAVELAIRAGFAMNGQVNPKSVFARKNYFYPDLPKGYQISQFDEPLCVKGTLTIESEAGEKKIRIHRIHMEEDAGKLLHGDNLLTIEGSLVDLNRAGVPLIEIVGEPDISSAAEAQSYLKKLRSILRYIDVCDGNMEEGSFRCDANVSIRPVGTQTLGTKVEIKNMNSFKHVQKAIEYEIERQKEVLGSNGKIVQETRLWNPDKGETRSMRSKEHAHDYRYFPEPDLKPLIIDDAWLAEIKRTLPELPDDRKRRFEDAYRLPPYDADVLTAEKEVASFYEETLKIYGATTPDQYKKASNLIMSEVLRLANDRGESVENLKIRPAQLAQLMKLIDAGTISGKMAKDVLDEMAANGGEPEAIVQSKGLSQISDRGAIEKIIREVVAQNPGQAEQYRSGKDKLFGFFVGQVMKATKGQANPQMVNDLLKEELARGV